MPNSSVDTFEAVCSPQGVQDDFSFLIWQQIFKIVAESEKQALESNLPIVALEPFTLWSRAEFRIENVPATTNPFDPDLLRLDAVFQLPSDKAAGGSGVLVSRVPPHFIGGQ